MSAYNKDYLDDAMDNLGGMLDYAVNDCGFDLDVMLGMFISSGIAEYFGEGSPRYVAGISGEEMALYIFEK